MEEMRQSVRIIHQCLNKMTPGEVRVDDHKVAPPRRSEMKVTSFVLLNIIRFYLGLENEMSVGRPVCHSAGWSVTLCLDRPYSLSHSAYIDDIACPTVCLDRPYSLSHSAYIDHTACLTVCLDRPYSLSHSA